MSQSEKKWTSFCRFKQTIHWLNFTISFKFFPNAISPDDTVSFRSNKLIHCFCNLMKHSSSMRALIEGSKTQSKNIIVHCIYRCCIRHYFASKRCYKIKIVIVICNCHFSWMILINNWCYSLLNAIVVITIFIIIIRIIAIIIIAAIEYQIVVFFYNLKWCHKYELYSMIHSNIFFTLWF